MDAIHTTSGNPRWDRFVELNDVARDTLRLSDATAAGIAYRAWCLDEDIPFEPLTPGQLRLWRFVIEWAGKLSRGVPGASSELCIARGRFVHSFYVRKEQSHGGETNRSQGDGEGREGGSQGCREGSRRQGRQAEAGEAET